MSTSVLIGLGSNLGDRVAAVFEAIDRIDGVDGLSVVRISTLIESDPVGVTDQPDYVNAAALVDATIDPGACMRALLEIECGMGRDRTSEIRFGPRTIDLDLLLWGEDIIDSADLTVPHPRLHERAFVLLPLVELDPDRIHPIFAQCMRTLLAADIDAHGAVESRCRPIRRIGLQEDGGLHGPRMDESL